MSSKEGKKSSSSKDKKRTQDKGSSQDMTAPQDKATSNDKTTPSDNQQSQSNQSEGRGSQDSQNSFFYPPPPQTGPHHFPHVPQVYGQQMGQPMYGQPMPQSMYSPMGQPMAQPMLYPKGPPMGQPMGQMMAPPMGQPMPTYGQYMMPQQPVGQVMYQQPYPGMAANPYMVQKPMVPMTPMVPMAPVGQTQFSANMMNQYPGQQNYGQPMQYQTMPDGSVVPVGQQSFMNSEMAKMAGNSALLLGLGIGQQYLQSEEGKKNLMKGIGYIAKNAM